MIIIKLIVKTLFKMIGFTLIILGQGLVLLTTISGCLMQIITGFFFLGAIVLSFADTISLGAKITYWAIAIVLGAITTNIHAIPQWLVEAGTNLVDYDF